MNAIIYTTNTGSTEHYATMDAKGPLWERAEHFDGEIPLF